MVGERRLAGVGRFDFWVLGWGAELGVGKFWENSESWTCYRMGNAIKKNVQRIAKRSKKRNWEEGNIQKDVSSTTKEAATHFSSI